MTASSSKKHWPEYLPLPQDDIFAIGVVALNYCQLENMLRAIFSSVTRLNEFQTAALFHRMANNVREDVLSELLVKTSLPDEARSLVEHFLKGFRLCAANRHGIMHSSSGGLYVNRAEGSRGLVLQRYSRAGNKLVCYLALEDLKVVADEIHSFTSFGGFVCTEATNYVTHLRAGHPEDYRPLPATLRKKPPLPNPLSWNAPADPKEHGIPPAASHLISAYRVHDVK